MSDGNISMSDVGEEEVLEKPQGSDGRGREVRVRKGDSLCKHPEELGVQLSSSFFELFLFTLS